LISPMSLVVADVFDVCDTVTWFWVTGAETAGLTTTEEEGRTIAFVELTFTATLTARVCAAAAFAAAAAPQKAILVSYPDDTPNHVVETAKKEIKKAGGLITHEYHFFKGFAANAPEKIFKTIKTLDSKFKATIEEDEMVSIQDSSNH